MGETICPNCDYMNSHIYCHATGKCERCGGEITYCDSCNCPITAEERPVWNYLMERLRAKEIKAFTVDRKKNKAFTVQFKDIADRNKNPNLSLSVESIMKNKKIPKKEVKHE